MIARTCLFAALLSVIGPVMAEPDISAALRDPAMGNYKAYAEYKMAHYDNARAIWEALDKRGNGDAAFNLGVLYEDGKGVPTDMDKALAYYQRARQNGSEKGLYRLGILYLYGNDRMAANISQARRYLSEAAALDDEQAQQHLTELDAGASGEPGPMILADRAFAAGHAESAADLLLEAAKAGNADAQTRLAWCYESGRGVDRDLQQAVVWFQQAAKQGQGEAMYALAVMRKTGVGLPRDEQAANRWLQRSAGAGYAQARLELANNHQR